MSDKVEKAIAVALAVSARRARGENVSDEEVIRQHADLSPYIEQELVKLKVLGNAREQVQKSHSDDLRFTTMVSDDDEEDDEPPVIETGFAATAVDARKKIEKTRPFRPQSRPPMAMLKIYHDNQRAYETRFIRSDRIVIGRTMGDLLIEHDPLISSQHVEIRRVAKGNRWEWHLKDLSSTNGTFISVDKARLSDGDEMLMGSQRYRFCLTRQEARLEHLVRNEVADRMALSPKGTLVGRDKSDQMNAFWDEFLDPKHAFIQLDRDQTWQITNTKSLNGVWFRVNSLRLFRSCFFQIGDQRVGFRT